jgi:hypothetical protein
MRCRLAFSGLAAVLFGASPARATPDFPGLIISHLNITCSNPLWDGQGCTICHLTNGGGLGTVQHPFGAHLKAMGLSAYDESALTMLLDQEKTKLDDFNCDGTADITQLEMCQWEQLATVDTCGQSNDGGMPSGDSGNNDVLPAEGVVYGCSASNARASTLPASVAGSVAGFLVVAVARRRIRARKQTR